MYIPGNIIYFTPFYFSDGFLPKPKYFIVLDFNIENGDVLACLTTTLDSIPNFITKQHGCIDKPEINFNCYYFKKDQIITENGWGFPKDTFVYGYRLTLLSIVNLTLKFVIENVDYRIIGKLKEFEFDAIIHCLKDSKSVKRKFRRSLGANI